MLLTYFLQIFLWMQNFMKYNILDISNFHETYGKFRSLRDKTSYN